MLFQRQTQTTSHHAYKLHSQDRTRMKAHNKINALFPQSKQEREGMRGIESHLVIIQLRKFSQKTSCTTWSELYPPNTARWAMNVTHKNRTNKHFFKCCAYCKYGLQPLRITNLGLLNFFCFVSLPSVFHNFSDVVIHTRETQMTQCNYHVVVRVSVGRAKTKESWKISNLFLVSFLFNLRKNSLLESDALVRNIHWNP